MPITVEIREDGTEVVIAPRGEDPVVIHDPDGVAEALVHDQTTPAASVTISPEPGMFTRRPHVTIFINGEVVLADVSVSGTAPFPVYIEFAEPTVFQAILS